MASWNVALTDAEVAMLAAGASPLLIRPQSLVFYLPMRKGDSLTDWAGGITMTNNGTTESGDHPPVWYPSKSVYSRGAAIAAAVDLSTTARGYAQQLDIDKSATARGYAQGVVDLLSTARGYAQGVADLSATARGRIVRWPTQTHTRQTPPPVHVLVEIDWPGGARRYSDHDLAVETTGYDGQLLDVGEVVQAIGQRRDSVEVSLVNRALGVPTLESLWTDAAPPEGATLRVYYHFEGETLAQRIQVFAGEIDEVIEISDGKVRVSALAFGGSDKLLGTPIDTATFPDAPEASIGRMQPIVFGAVTGLELVPTTTIGRSALAGVALASDMTIDLEDASDFPASGSIKILEEQIDYYSKTGDTLNVTARGVAPTTASAYASGTPVVEIGGADYLAAAHACAAIANVYAYRGDRRVAIAAGDYTATLTAPAKIAFADGPPLVPVPAGGATLLQVQMDQAGSGNAATNPLNAAADAAGWTQKNYASVSKTATPLELEQIDTVTPLGELRRVWALVEYDGSTLPATDTVELRRNGGLTTLTTLSATGGISDEMRQLIGLGVTRAYDDTHTINNPTHQHAAQTHADEVLKLQAMETTGWSGTPGNVIDDDFTTSASYNSSTARKLYRQTVAPDEVQTLVKFRAKIDCTPGAASLTLRFYVNGTLVSTKTTSGSGRQTLTTTYKTTSSWAAIRASNTYVTLTDTAPVTVYQVWYEITWTEQAPSVAQATSQSSNQPLAHSVAVLHDLSAVLTSWALLKNDTLQVAHVGTADATSTRVVRLGYVVEYSPLRKEPADRILANVTGLVSDGGPVDILRSIITDSSLLGLAAAAYNAGALLAAEAKLDTLPYVLAGVVVERVQAADLIADVCRQARLHHWWQAGALFVSYQEAIASMASPAITYRLEDLVPGSLKRSRTPLDDVETDLVARYAYSWRHGRYTATAAASVASTVGGAKTSQRSWWLHRAAASAGNLATHRIERAGKPRYQLEWATYLPGLEVARGDIVGLDAQDWSYSKVEVVDVRIAGVEVRFRGIVWDAL